MDEEAKGTERKCEGTEDRGQDVSQCQKRGCAGNEAGREGSNEEEKQRQRWHHESQGEKNHLEEKGVVTSEEASNTGITECSFARLLVPSAKRASGAKVSHRELGR